MINDNLKALIDMAENTFNANSIKFHKIHMWPFLRFNMVNNEMSGRVKPKGDVITKKIFRNIFSFPLIFIKFLSGIIKLMKVSIKRSQCINIWTYDVNRVEYNGHSFNKFSDSIDNFSGEYKIVNMEKNAPYLKSYHSFAVNVDTKMYEDIVALIAIIFSYLKPINSKHPLLCLIGNLSSSFPSQSLPSTRGVSYLAWRAYFLSRVFKAIMYFQSPVVNFVTNWYSLRGIAICIASKELGIPVADIQHGLAAGSGQRGYVNLSRMEKITNNLPDFFFSWTEVDAVSLQNEGCLAINSGIPWLDFFAFEEGKDNSNKLKVVIICGVNIPLWVGDLIYAFDHEDIEVVIKEHPSYPLSSKKLKALQDKAKKSKVSIARKDSISVVLLDASCVFGEWSAGLLESIVMGLDTYIIGKLGKDYFLKFAPHPNVHFFDNGGLSFEFALDNINGELNLFNQKKAKFEKELHQWIRINK